MSFYEAVKVRQQMGGGGYSAARRTVTRSMKQRGLLDAVPDSWRAIRALYLPVVGDCGNQRVPSRQSQNAACSVLTVFVED